MAQIFCCMDAIEHIEWSCDSKFVVCGIFKRGLAQAWSIERPEWHCTVDEGPVGLAHVRFSPDGRHLLATADFNVRITVWSLLDRSVYYIRFPKFPKAGLCFSPDGRCASLRPPPPAAPAFPRRPHSRRMMAVAERRDFRDAISIVETGGWRPLRRFEVATQDLADISWSPDGKVICVIDTLLQYQEGARNAPPRLPCHTGRYFFHSCLHTSGCRCSYIRPTARSSRGSAPTSMRSA